MLVTLRVQNKKVNYGLEQVSMFCLGFMPLALLTNCSFTNFSQ